MLNVPDVHDTRHYNAAYQKAASIDFEQLDNEDNNASALLLILQKKLVFLAKNTSIATEHPTEFVEGIKQLNQLVKKYNTVYPSSRLDTLPLPPRPQWFERIPTPLKSITQVSDLGITHDWRITALKTGSIATGIACNLIGATAGRYSLQAANTLLQHTVAEVMVHDIITNTLKAAALGSLNGAAFVAPFVGNNTLIIDASEQNLCERYPIKEYVSQEDEAGWEHVEPGIQVILSATAQTFEQNGDLISACLFNDLYAINSWRYLPTQEAYDDSEILAVVQTLEYLTCYFTIFYPQSKRILYDIITSYYADIFKHTEYYQRFLDVQTNCEPEHIGGKVAEYAVSMIAFPGYDLIDWNKLQQLRANPPKELLEKLGEVRQFNKETITHLNAMNYKQYHTQLLSLYADDYAIAPLLQQFSDIFSKKPTDAQATHGLSEPRP